MTDFEKVQTTQTPRPDDLCWRLARRLAPAWGFAMYGVLYLVTVANAGAAAAGFCCGYLLSLVLHVKPWPDWAVALTLTIAALGFAVSWLPFRAWVRRRRGEFRELIRRGTLVDGQVVQALTLTLQGAPITRGKISFTEEGRAITVTTSFGAFLDSFVVGATQPVLYHPGARFAVAFPLAGRAAAARVVKATTA